MVHKTFLERHGKTFYLTPEVNGDSWKKDMIWLHTTCPAWSKTPEAEGEN